MSNPLFNALGGGMPQGNGPMQMMQQFMQFKQNFKCFTGSACELLLRDPGSYPGRELQYGTEHLCIAEHHEQ